MNTPNQQKTHIPVTSFGNKEILSFREATTYLDISKSFLYKLTSLHKIKFFKPNNGKIYFRRSDLDSWMLQNECKGL